MSFISLFRNGGNVLYLPTLVSIRHTLTAVIIDDDINSGYQTLTANLELAPLSMATWTFFS